MELVRQQRVGGLRWPFNSCTASHLVSVFRTDLCDFVIVTDGDDGPSITNAAAYHCPQIAHRLGLEWRHCVFVEHYAHDEGASFARIRFLGSDAAPGIDPVSQIPYAASPVWQPLGEELAVALQGAGLDRA